MAAPADPPLPGVGDDGGGTSLPAKRDGAMLEPPHAHSESEPASEAASPTNVASPLAAVAVADSADGTPHRRSSRDELVSSSGGTTSSPMSDLLPAAEDTTAAALGSAQRRRRASDGILRSTSITSELSSADDPLSPDRNRTASGGPAHTGAGAPAGSASAAAGGGVLQSMRSVLQFRNWARSIVPSSVAVEPDEEPEETAPLKSPVDRVSASPAAASSWRALLALMWCPGWVTTASFLRAQEEVERQILETERLLEKEMKIQIAAESLARHYTHKKKADKRHVAEAVTKVQEAESRVRALSERLERLRYNHSVLLGLDLATPGADTEALATDLRFTQEQVTARIQRIRERIAIETNVKVRSRFGTQRSGRTMLSSIGCWHCTHVALGFADRRGKDGARIGQGTGHNCAQGRAAGEGKKHDGSLQVARQCQRQAVLAQYGAGQIPKHDQVQHGPRRRAQPHRLWALHLCPWSPGWCRCLYVPRLMR